jgi:hypothetical protein
MTMGQLTLDFRSGLTAQHRSLREVTAATVYASHKGVAGVAGDLDMSPTDLTKRLNLDSAEPRIAEEKARLLTEILQGRAAA